MRKLSGAPKLAKKQDNTLEFTFSFDDGSSETISCPSELVPELLDAVATFDPSRVKAQQSAAVDILEVSYEAGTGQVAIGIPAEQETIRMVMGQERAVGLAERLVRAAEKSRAEDPQGSSI